MLHGLHTTTLFKVGIKYYAGFEGYIVGPDSSVFDSEYLEGRLAGFGG
jgi:hypothetical protein